MVKMVLRASLNNQNPECFSCVARNGFLPEVRPIGARFKNSTCLCIHEQVPARVLPSGDDTFDDFDFKSRVCEEQSHKNRAVSADKRAIF